MRVVVHVNANPNTEPVVYSQVDAAALANTFDSTASKLREYKGVFVLRRIRLKSS